MSFSSGSKLHLIIKMKLGTVDYLGGVFDYLDIFGGGGYQRIIKQKLVIATISMYSLGASLNNWHPEYPLCHRRYLHGTA